VIRLLKEILQQPTIWYS